MIFSKLTVSFRNPKHRIAPIVTLSGSLVNAFDDIKAEDPGFAAIQGTRLLIITSGGKSVFCVLIVYPPIFY